MKKVKVRERIIALCLSVLVLMVILRFVFYCPKPLIKLETSVVATWVIDAKATDKPFTVAGIAVGKDNVYISNIVKHRIDIYTLNGKYIHSFGSFGGKPGQFNEPSGIAIDKDGNVYVTDATDKPPYTNDRVQEFDKYGNYIKKLEGVFYCPRNIAINSDGLIYVADTGNRTVKCFSADGKYMGQARYKFPGEVFGLAIDKDGNVYVGDRLGARIVIMNWALNKIKTICVPQWNNLPMWNMIAIRSGLVTFLYVVSNKTNQILRYTLDENLNVNGSIGVIAFSQPFCIALKDDAIYVTENTADRIANKLFFSNKIVELKY